MWVYGTTWAAEGQACQLPKKATSRELASSKDGKLLSTGERVGAEEMDGTEQSVSLNITTNREYK